MIRIILLFLAFSSVAHAQSNEELEQRMNELTDQIEQINHKYDLLLKRVDSLTEDIAFKQKELATKPSQNKEPAKKAANNTSAKAEFEKAYALLKEQHHAEAEQSFETFISSYPNSEYTGPAYYWLGETCMLRKRYDKASVNFIQSFSKFPKNNKADLSILKLASALNMLNKKKEACEMLAKLKPKANNLNPSMQKLLKKELAQNNCK